MAVMHGGLPVHENKHQLYSLSVKPQRFTDKSDVKPRTPTLLRQTQKRPTPLAQLSIITILYSETTEQLSMTVTQLAQNPQTYSDEGGELQSAASSNRLKLPRVNSGREEKLTEQRELVRVGTRGEQRPVSALTSHPTQPFQCSRFTPWLLII